MISISENVADELLRRMPDPDTSSYVECGLAIDIFLCERIMAVTKIRELTKMAVGKIDCLTGGVIRQNGHLHQYIKRHGRG